MSIFTSKQHDNNKHIQVIANMKGGIKGGSEGKKEVNIVIVKRE